MALTPAAAQALLMELATPLPAEAIGLLQARGRILAAPVVADRDLPASDRSAMDGYACRARDTASPPQSLQVLGTVAAGDPPSLTISPGTCVRIYTGAVIPSGADCVVMQEVAEASPEGSVLFRVPATAGQHVLRRGEDTQAGRQVLPSGGVLGPAQLSVCAAVGQDPVTVFGQPRVRLIPTGSELKQASEAVEAHELRETNSYAVRGLIETLTPAQVMAEAPLPDDPVLLRAALASVALSADVVVTIGGASVGPRDFLGGVVREMGGTIHAERLLMKPGKPVVLATLGSVLLLGLPGSPLACLTAARILLIPLLLRLAGHAEPLRTAQITARLTTQVINKPGRTRFLLVRLTPDDAGVLRATPVQTASVADLVAAATADALLELPPETDTALPDAPYRCWMLHGWPV